jgi:peptidoglycan hydrolase CwlO-like protein
MKKITIIPLLLLMFGFSFLGGFAQTTSDKEVLKLSSDIKKLEQKNNKLKKEVADNVVALNKSIEDLKGMVQGTESKMSSVKESLTATNATVSSMQQETNNRLLQYKSTMNTVIVIGFLVLIALVIMILMQASRFKKEIAETKELAADQINGIKKETTSQLDALKTSLVAQISEVQKSVNSKLAKN